MEEQEKLAKWLEGSLDQETLADFRQSAEYAVYERIARMSQQLQAPDFDEQLLLEKITRNKKHGKKQRSYFRTVTSIAAILIIGLGIFLAFPFEETIVKTAQNGSTLAFSLPDGSAVFLNSGSKISYTEKNWKQNRSLTLQGEAYFEVAKGRTFEVKTDLGKVGVLGTKFNVKAREKRFETECFQGKVWTQTAIGKQVLEAGQIIVVENSAKLSATPSPNEKPAWMLQQLRFIATPFSQIAAEIERQYDIEIQKPLPKAKETFNGTLPSQNLDQAVLILCKSYGLSVKTVGNKLVFSANE